MSNRLRASEATGKASAPIDSAALLDALVSLVAGRVIEQLRTAQDAQLVRADRTGLGSRKVRQLIKAGKLTGSKIGKSWFIAPAELAALMASHGPAPAVPPAELAPVSGAAAIAARLGLERVAPARAAMARK